LTKHLLTINIVSTCVCSHVSTTQRGHNTTITSLAIALIICVCYSRCYI